METKVQSQILFISKCQFIGDSLMSIIFVNELLWVFFTTDLFLGVQDYIFLSVLTLKAVNFQKSPN